MCEMEVIPQLEDLLKETTWKFPPEALALIRGHDRRLPFRPLHALAGSSKKPLLLA